MAVNGQRSIDEEAIHFRADGQQWRDEKLSEATVWAYSVGHVMNDAAAACWFSYLLVYLERVRKLTSMNAGIVMFSGQIFDALATPLVGIASDATGGKGACGGRMLYYILGSIAVVFCFTAVFAFDPFKADGETYSVIYFAFGASTFNIGWASVQVAHLAIIPDLTREDCERVRLVKLRYAFTILSNLSVFLLYLHPGPYHGALKYKIIVAAVLGVGGILSLWFVRGVTGHLSQHASISPRKGGTLATAVNGAASSCTEDGIARAPSYSSINHLMTPVRTVSGYGAPTYWYDWLLVKDFYLSGIIYMCSRIVVNISQVYLQFYILDTLGMGDSALALVPLTLYISGLFATCLTEYLNERFGRKSAFIVGGIIVVAACIGFHLLTPAAAPMIYPVACVLGAGSTALMITSHSMANDLVGEHPSGGFVYGAFSLLDKMGNGILILGIQSLKQACCPPNELQHLGQITPSCSNLIRRVLVFLPALSVLVATIATFFITVTQEAPSKWKIYRYSSFVESADHHQVERRGKADRQ